MWLHSVFFSRDMHGLGFLLVSSKIYEAEISECIQIYTAGCLEESTQYNCLGF